MFKLSQDKLDFINEMCEKWLLKPEIIKKIKIQPIDWKSLYNLYLKRLNEVPHQFSDSNKISGAVCFFGSLCTSLLHFGHIKEIEHLFTFALCYLLIDHFLDDIENTKESKEKMMKEIYNFILGDENENNKILNCAGKRYLNLIKDKPHCKKILLKLFQCELKGAKIQKYDNLKREDYLNIMKEKGGLTTLSIASIIGLEDDESNFNLGSIIQAVDDLLDIKDDEKLNIYTLARYDFDHDNLDEYIYSIFKEINQLNSKYNLFKIILSYGLILGIHDNGYISDELMNNIKKYDPFDNETSKETIIDFISEKMNFI